MQSLYRASDALLAQRAAIEGHLFEQVADLFALAPNGHALPT